MLGAAEGLYKDVWCYHVIIQSDLVPRFAVGALNRGEYIERRGHSCLLSCSMLFWRTPCSKHAAPCRQDAVMQQLFRLLNDVFKERSPHETPTETCTKTT